MAKSFPFSPPRSYLPPFDTLPRTQNNSRGTDSEIEVRVSLKNPYRSVFMAWRVTRPGDFELERTRAFETFVSFAKLFHPLAPCGNSSPPTSPWEHHPQLKEQWDTHGVSRNSASSTVHIERANGEGTGPMICRGIERRSPSNKRREIEGLRRCISRWEINGCYLSGISEEIFGYHAICQHWL